MITNENIKIPNNNSFSFTCEAVADNGTPVSFVEGDIVYMTIKKYATEIPVIAQKTITTFPNGQLIINFLFAEILAIPVGVYVYDVVWVKTNGDVKSIFPSSSRCNTLPNFEICQGVYKP